MFNIEVHFNDKDRGILQIPSNLYTLSNMEHIKKIVKETRGMEAVIVGLKDFDVEARWIQIDEVVEW